MSLSLEYFYKNYVLINGEKPAINDRKLYHLRVVQWAADNNMNITPVKRMRGGIDYVFTPNKSHSG